MADATRPLSVRLPDADHTRLSYQAKRLSGTPSALARELIRSGLAGNDPAAQAERLLKIERRLAAISQDVAVIIQSTEQQAQSLGHVDGMFRQLLHALAGEPLREETPHVHS